MVKSFSFVEIALFVLATVMINGEAQAAGKAESSNPGATCTSDGLCVEQKVLAPVSDGYVEATIESIIPNVNPHLPINMHEYILRDVNGLGMRRSSIHLYRALGPRECVTIARRTLCEGSPYVLYEPNRRYVNGQDAPARVLTITGVREGDQFFVVKGYTSVGHWPAHRFSVHFASLAEPTETRCWSTIDSCGIFYDPSRRAQGAILATLPRHGGRDELVYMRIYDRTTNKRPNDCVFNDPRNECHIRIQEFAFVERSELYIGSGCLQKDRDTSGDSMCVGDLVEWSRRNGRLITARVAGFKDDLIVIQEESSLVANGLIFGLRRHDLVKIR